MQLENKERLIEIYNQIKPIMDNEIQWGNPLLNMLVAIALDKYSQIDINADFKDLLSFVGYSGIIKIYAPIKPTPGVVGGGNNLRAADAEDAIWLISKEDDDDHEYFIDELYAKLLTYSDENMIKRTCRRLDLTYKQLGEKIGISESTLLSIASTGKLSKQIETSIELYKRNIELEEKLANSEKIKETLKEWLK